MTNIVPYAESNAVKAHCVKCDLDAQIKMINKTTFELFCRECGSQTFLIKKEE